MTEQLKRIASTLAQYNQRGLAAEVADISLTLKAAGLPPEFLEQQKKMKEKSKDKDDDKDKD